jgi:DNA-binding beta-propeller fold protein YncE
MRSSTFTLLALLAVPGFSAANPEPAAGPVVIPIPGGEAGVGYDDLQYAPTLRRVLVPAGRTGTLALIEPATGAVTTIGGFTGASSYRGGHGQGTTSAAELDGWPGFVVATDRGATALRVVDARAGKISQTVKLAAAPDYVRVVSASEVWVTEPARKQLEVLRVEGKNAPRLVTVGTISVPDGPESLVIDAARGKAYCHSWKGQTFAVELKARKVVATWSNGCQGSRGIALDQRRGLLFAGCAEGRVTVVDLASRTVVATAAAGPDIDSIAYAADGGDGPRGGHLYVPAGGSAELWILGVDSNGTLTALGRVPTGRDAHTVAVAPGAPGAPLLFVGTPEHGAVLRVIDRFAAPPTP